MTCREPFPASIASNDHLEIILRSLRDYIGIHHLVLDPDNTIIDTQLLWWNDGYETIRVEPVVPHQSMMDTYFEPHVSLGFVRDAWTQGKSHQIFELSEETFDKYRAPETLVRIEVVWLRINDFILEIGSDLSEMTRLELELIAQREAYSQATRETLLSIERARIGRDLHDSIIQSLYAISLNLRAREDKDWAIDAIHKVITEIRSTIFDISPLTQPPISNVVENVVEMFARAWSHRPTVTCTIDQEPPDDVVEDIEAVVREGLSNVARHAHAEHVSVRVIINANTVDITIEDDGVGPKGSQHRRAGIASLERRATQQGGNFALEAREAGGTRLWWTCPLN